MVGVDYAGPPLVSLEAGIAEGLGLNIGDTITLNVLGRNVTATIRNLREVNWRSFAINFVFVFSPNTFKGAPYTVLVTAALPSEAGAAAESAMMKAAARDFPSVSAVRVRDALETIEALTAKLALAIRSASGIALAYLGSGAGRSARGQSARPHRRRGDPEDLGRDARAADRDVSDRICAARRGDGAFGVAAGTARRLCHRRRGDGLRFRLRAGAGPRGGRRGARVDGRARA